MFINSYWIRTLLSQIHPTKSDENGFQSEFIRFPFFPFCLPLSSVLLKVWWANFNPFSELFGWLQSLFRFSFNKIQNHCQNPIQFLICIIFRGKRSKQSYKDNQVEVTTWFLTGYLLLSWRPSFFQLPEEFHHLIESKFINLLCNLWIYHVKAFCSSTRSQDVDRYFLRQMILTRLPFSYFENAASPPNYWDDCSPTNPNKYTYYWLI